MELCSPDFNGNDSIPERHTCDGSDQSPGLRWGGLPKGARSLVLVVDDPDAPDPAAPQRTWVHWLLYDIPPNSSGLPAGGLPLPAGTMEGLNDWNRTGYGGPCPPIGRHRYFFRLFALDTTLSPLAHPTRADVEEAMRGHVLAHAELMGTYRRRGNS
jgi:Raf kinase inhibitor-like YbhB/YbcL family protein